MTFKEITEITEELALPILDKEGAFLVEVRVRVERGATVIQVFVDTDSGITIDQCATISRSLKSMLDTHGTLATVVYQLEVSSPGLDQPLKLLRQYQKNVGRRFHVRFSTGHEPGSMTATLVAVQGDQVTFRPEAGEEISLPFNQILESKEELPW
jgi:ribosome maturation factor RimP